ncbi:uncharacterized protein P174DRAFT_197549 [Aspergillus novofumigatus IBT 16806]|uniref:Integral membrane protein n=1 Tax=Aspergillus novofumigatus (strain IBT 16806) TaxID=1392255 RepID=A0A2I1C3Z3_ASPN1|nr:uncharacterized protein P174DRAFT_197549 [Aspergillus novofumigatus IBT 16806]PKX92346.1 hypothetical protein P174DRAFT_197549 [Aspergillus novofumigatus IBT 16806]
MPSASLQLRYASPERRIADIVAITFDMVTEIALLAFLSSSCLIRRPRHHPNAIPFKSLFICLLSHIITDLYRFFCLIHYAFCSPRENCRETVAPWQ